MINPQNPIQISSVVNGEESKIKTTIMTKKQAVQHVAGKMREDTRRLNKLAAKFNKH